MERDDEPSQAFYAGVSREREVDHDSNLYATYRQEEARLRDEHDGLEIRRVVLEQDLKREYQEFLQEHNRGRADSDGRPDRDEHEIREWAREHDLPYFDEQVHFPDYRIEYEVDGREHHQDVELFTEHYRGAHAASHAQTGFRIYVVGSRGGRRTVRTASARHGGVPVTHEYPSHDIYDSVTEARVNALSGFGFTQRQREFLVTVMVHSGCFLERQYCAFTGTVRGQNSREFMARLVARGFARAIEPGPVRRGRLYHVHHKPLYEAIGQADNRNRRLRTIGRMVERVMILDAVLGDRRCWWLSPADDKWRFFCLKRDNYLRPEDYPHIAFGSGRQRTIRCFPDKLPIGIEKDRTEPPGLRLPREPAPAGGLPAVPVPSRRPAPLRDHVDGSAARATPVPQGRGALQGRPSRGALDAAEPERQQGAGDVLSRTPGTGRTPRRSRRSLHQGGVPEAGDAEDPGPLSRVATRG